MKRAKGLLYCGLGLLLTSVVSGETLLDDFEDGDLAGWRFTEGWSVQDGEAVGEASDYVAEFVRPLLRGNSLWRNYTIEARVKLEAFVTNRMINGFGLIVRANTAGGVLSGLGFGGNFNSGHVGVVQYPDNNVVVIFGPTFAFTRNRWYRLKVEAEGPRFRFFVDDRLVGEFVSNRFEAGAVGLVALSSRVRFDDVTISGPEVVDCNETLQGEDSDGDGVINFCDNCPTRGNPRQLDTDGDGTGDFCDEESRHVPGDCNQDGSTDIADVLCYVGMLFKGFLLLDRTPPDLPCASDEGNLAVMDVNGDSRLDTGDVIYMAQFLFAGGEPPTRGLECMFVGEGLNCSGACP